MSKEIFLPLLVYNTNGITDKIPAKVLPVDDLMHFLDEGPSLTASCPYSIPQSPVTEGQVASVNSTSRTAKLESEPPPASGLRGRLALEPAQDLVGSERKPWLLIAALGRISRPPI